ncbi:MAG: NADH-quinone oxidoreductase subunit J [Chitinophagales bacterium]|jgi:NADH-quinone oxidoreductase subunit J|nr:NADH-quinone oxidoreductase subunit J [Bacteroidota bacterium]MBK7567338.1 NADH-quinone oxidoreductase subunit J [Bacteroidota bacterium]MBP9221608.1 NADH-quinone oxidoreductase subunit J [Chitinophagales bacterium]MBP9796056.1 NADH-quinone oxidoreductase subunit J [Chitinophagales bacterium]
MTQIFFYFLSGIAIASSLLMLFQRNAMYSVLYLLVCFFAVAGLYIMLNAQFLAIVHIIVYAGAIMVLFLYVLMFLNLNTSSTFSKSNLLRFAAVLTGGMVFILLFASFYQTQLTYVADSLHAETGSVQTLGKVLFDEFLIPFELTSILFLSAMVGVVIINKKESSNG